MSLKNQVNVSEVQLNLDLTEEEMNQGLDCTDRTDESDELINLLAEILESEFCHQPEDSLNVLSGNAIYCLDDTRTIEERERFEQQQLDEGCASLGKLDELEQQAQAHFRNPALYPLSEGEEDLPWVTGYFQTFRGVSFDKAGNLKENWRTIGSKVVFGFDDLFHPERLIELAKVTGYELNETTRMVVYGPNLESLVGSKLYLPKASKDLIPLVDGNNLIMLSVPSMEDCDLDVSLYEWVNSLKEESILYGNKVDINRMSEAHWEITQGRLEELAAEESELKNLLHFGKREASYAKRQSEFNSRYKEARDFIQAVNSTKEYRQALYSMNLSVLDDILFLAEKCNERISNVAAYLEVRALASKRKIQTIQDENSEALSIIQRINKGELVEVHLLSLITLEQIFSILWSSCGIRIAAEYKEFYFQLKERLLRMRSAKSGKTA
jgi:hypothetical protein